MRWRSNIERFMSFIDRRDGHWLWLGQTTKKGYGQFWDNETKRILHAHRWSYEHFIGLLQTSQDAHHKCEYKHCVHPDHQEPVEHSYHPGTIQFIRRNITHCPRGHIYNDENTAHYSGRRVCRICERARNVIRGRKRREQQRLCSRVS